jgi:hypothetical protein
MTFEDVVQQYFDPLAQTQRAVRRYRCKILLRGTHTMFPGIGDDRSHLNANASHKPLLELPGKNLQHSPLTKLKRRQTRSLPAINFYLYKAQNTGKTRHRLNKDLSTDTQWKIRRPEEEPFRFLTMDGILSQVGEDVHGGGLNCYELI